MALWGVRAGRHGEREAYCLDHSVVAIGWEELDDISAVSSRERLDQLMAETYPNLKKAKMNVWTGEVWAFKQRIAEGDLVALPLRNRAAVAFGEVIGPYTYVGDAPPEAQHQRPVKWLRTDVPRTEIEPDILSGLNCALTVFQARSVNAEQRVRDLIAGRIRRAEAQSLVAPNESATIVAGPPDIEQQAKDQITDFIGHHFKEHRLSSLVAGILRSEGYKVAVARPGADGGVDIVAGRGPMGFDPPRLCVQVKSGRGPADVGVLRELKGVMSIFGAQHGLIVSWGGFRQSVHSEARRQFFEIRLWDAGDVVSAVQQAYERFSEDLQAEIPLKRVWIMVPSD
jgi:restriction system protein